MPGTISPNGDGDADVATIGFDLAASAVVTVAVADQAGTVVATPSPSVAHDVGRVTATWNGLGLDGLTPVPDGIYRVLITATSLTGEARALVAQVNVVRAAALFALPRLASSPNGDGRYDRVSATWRQDALAPVTVDLELRGKRVRRLFSGLVAPGPATRGLGRTARRPDLERAVPGRAARADGRWRRRSSASRSRST